MHMIQQLKEGFTRKRGESGFTIIEVMIVLAIAGLILLIVFLAVPALQRNSRNTQRKNDVAAVLAAVSEYSDNNNGQSPATCSFASPSITVGAAPATIAQAKVGYYNAGCSATANPGVGAVGFTAGAHAAVATDALVITTGANCNGTAAVVGSARGVVALYQIETGSGTVASVCQEG